MKKIILSSILMMGFTFVAKAQTFTLPKFSEKTVVITIDQYGKFEGSISASGGISEPYKMSFTGSLKNPIDFTGITANAINQMTGQGYKYLDSNGSGYVVNGYGSSITNYIFQKE